VPFLLLAGVAVAGCGEELGKERFGLNAKDFKVLPSGQIVFRAGHRPSDAAIFDAAARAVDGLEVNPATFADDAAVRRLFADARRTGRRYGLQECGL
jgi:hypothetical protein